MIVLFKIQTRNRYLLSKVRTYHYTQHNEPEPQDKKKNIAVNEVLDLSKIQTQNLCFLGEVRAYQDAT